MRVLLNVKCEESFSKTFFGLKTCTFLAQYNLRVLLGLRVSEIVTAMGSRPQEQNRTQKEEQYLFGIECVNVKRPLRSSGQRS
jgi:hypothetical protein